MNTTIVILLVGLAFGFLLNKSGMTKYNKIVNVFRFTDMGVLKFMMSSLIVSMSGLYILNAFGLVTFPNIPATYVVGNLVGGLIFGVGMAIAGFCPGTCIAGAGEGKLDYLIPGVLGFLTGAALYGLTYAQVFPAISSIANFGSAIIPELWDVNAFLFITLFVVVSLMLFYFIDRAGMQRHREI
jgi:hypothetical protein